MEAGFYHEPAGKVTALIATRDEMRCCGSRSGFSPAWEAPPRLVRSPSASAQHLDPIQSEHARVRSRWMMQPCTAPGTSSAPVRWAPLRIPEDGNGYILWSVGPDGENDLEDDIVLERTGSE